MSTTLGIVGAVLGSVFFGVSLIIRLLLLFHPPLRPPRPLRPARSFRPSSAYPSTLLASFRLPPAHPFRRSPLLPPHRLQLHPRQTASQLRRAPLQLVRVLRHLLLRPRLCHHHQLLVLLRGVGIHGLSRGADRRSDMDLCQRPHHLRHIVRRPRHRLQSPQRRRDTDGLAHGPVRPVRRHAAAATIRHHVGGGARLPPPCCGELLLLARQRHTRSSRPGGGTRSPSPTQAREDEETRRRKPRWRGEGWE